MKKLLFAFLLIPFIANAQEIKYQSDDGNFVLYELNGDEPCLARKNLKVIQAMRTTAHVCEVGNFSCELYWEGTMYLLDEHHYYDGEIIPNPAGKCAKQIGVYRYKTVNRFEDGSPIYKTVPVISILESNSQ